MWNPWSDLLGSAEYRAVHLEMRDSYMQVPAFHHWVATGEFDGPDAPVWADWQSLIRSTIQRGVVVQRARIVSEPLSDYIRWEHAVTGMNTAVGEEVRWLPRHRASDLALPGNDFWLIDDRLVLFTLFTGDGDAADPPGQESKDPAVVQLCAGAFDAVWNRATPHEEYQVR